MNSQNPKHQLAKLVMDAVVAGTMLSQDQQQSLAREIAQARVRAERDPWSLVSGGLRSGS